MGPSPDKFRAIQVFGKLLAFILPILTLLVLICIVTVGAPASLADEAAVSILRPARPGVPTYRYAVSRIDPTAASNPEGKTFPGFRGSNQLVIYTPKFGSETGTNEFGAEAVVIDNRIERITCCNSQIPVNGVVLSGHGAAGQWIKNNLKPGAEVEYDSQAGLLLVRMTPAVYLKLAQDALNRAAANQPTPDQQQAYSHLVQQTQSCVQHLASLNLVQADFDLPLPASSPGQDTELLKQAALESARCQDLAEKAYILSVKSYPDKFRGIWVRPIEKDPQQIEQVLARLKALQITDLFIETYYQGKTIYPSAVMERYGLSKQHPRYNGMDPLKLWIELAHQHGMKVHAWSQIFFAGNAQENAELYGPILNKYPQWANVQRAHLCAAVSCPLPAAEQEKQFTPKPSDAEEGHYFLDPANPQVRMFLDELLSEMVSVYDLDGMNLDYIRYPASYPVKSGRFFQSTWGYTPEARKAFREFIYQDAFAKFIAMQKASPKAKIVKPIPEQFDPLKLTPSSPLWAQWVAWRNEQVSTFVGLSSVKLKALKPDLKITAVVFPPSDPQGQMKLQDWPAWVANGWLDALTPIGLYPTAEGMYQDSLTLKRLAKDKVPIYAGVFGAYNRLSQSEFVSQIDAVHQAGLAGVVIFENSRLSEPYRDALQLGPFRTTRLDAHFD